MQTHFIFEQSYQEGGHGEFGGGAIYQNENLRGRTKELERKHWLEEAIKRYKKNSSVKAISYNGRCHSIYLHSTIDATKWRNKNNATFQGRPSDRHENHTFVLFNH